MISTQVFLFSGAACVAEAPQSRNAKKNLHLMVKQDSIGARADPTRTP
jgi:hypothetical protein